MLSCERIEKNLIAYLDAKADPVARRQVETHLADCADCRQRVSDFRAISGLLDEWPAAAPSPSFDAAVRARIAAEPQHRSWWSSLLPAPSLAFATCALVVLSVWMVSVHQQAPSPMVAVVEPQSSETDFKMIDDLPALENYDLLANFDALSDLPVQSPAPQARAQRP